MSDSTAQARVASREVPLGPLGRFFRLAVGESETAQRGQAVAIWGIASLLGVAAALVVTLAGGAAGGREIALYGGGLLATAGALALLRSGRSAAAAGLLLVVWLVLIGAMSLEQGPQSAVVLFYGPLTLLAALLISPLAGLIAGLGLAGVTVGLGTLGRADDLSVEAWRAQAAVVYPVLLAGLGLLAWLLADGLRRTIRQVEEANDELVDANRTLEARLGQRSTALETANEKLTRCAGQLGEILAVGQGAGQILSLDELLPRAAELVRERLEYYAAALYVPEEDGQGVELRGWSSATGAESGRDGTPGIVGQVLTGREAQVIQEVNHDPLYTYNPALPDTRSQAAVPLMAGERLLAVLEVQSTIPYVFDEMHLALLQMAAGLLAIAIDNAGKFMDEAAILSQTSVYYRYSQEITLAADEQRIGQALMDFTAAVGMDMGQFLTVETDAAGAPINLTMLTSWIKSDQPVPPLGMLLETHSFPLSQLISERKLLVVTDVQKDVRADANLQKVMKKVGLGSFVLVPLLSGDNWVGIWLLGRKVSGNLGPRLLRGCRSLAGQAAVVLERLRLIETTREQSQREQIINSVANRLRSQNSARRVLSSAAVEIGERLGAGRVGIWLNPPAQIAKGNGKPPQGGQEA